MEMMHYVRMVPVNGGPQLTSNIRQRLGSSRGHWDGDTFVVETANFRGSQRGGGGGRGTTETARLTEKFTRISADKLKYEVTMNDPATYTKP